MTPARVLAFAAGVYLLAGAAFLVAPDALFALLGQPIATGAARVDVRAVYGGLQLGLGGWLAVAAWRPAAVRAGLGVAGAGFAGLAAGRGVGVVIDGLDGPLIAGLLAAELTGAALCGWAWRRAAGG
ncbi:MAG: DUF4345 family protein [bacterium]